MFVSQQTIIDIRD